MKVTFPTEPHSIETRMNSIKPVLYGSSRNYIDGDVSLLSPYIARGYLSTKRIFDFVTSLDYKPYQITKFVQELAWRDYFQQVWKHKGDSIFSDLKQPQPETKHFLFPKAFLQNSINTGIPGINRELFDFYDNGYLHNHVRMYIASIICNIGGAYWKKPSQWMYYHLLDADLASNTCSWQWISGAFSSKKYVANQENINRYLKTNDQNTYLDLNYEELLKHKSLPRELETLVDWDLTEAYKTTKDWFESKLLNSNPGTNFVSAFHPHSRLILDFTLPICLYDIYNLDPLWKQNTQSNRIFMMRPSFFKKFPSSPKTLDFVFSLAKNIPNLQFFFGEWEHLQEHLKEFKPKIFFKEHPTNIEYVGIEESRDWIFPEVTGYHQSFFAYWKKCEKFWIRRNQDKNPTLF